MTILYIHSHYGAHPQGYAGDSRIVIVRERDLTAEHFKAAKGVITSTHLDQIGWLDHASALTAMLDRGGNWFFNGHILRPAIDGLALYVPLQKPRRADFNLTRLFDHPIYAGIDQKNLEENRGVAGFYGRGHNPLPEGGVAVNGIGRDLLPIDWAWDRPQGGRMFSHAGNDMGGMGGESGNGALLTRRIIAWCAGDI